MLLSSKNYILYFIIYKFIEWDEWSLSKKTFKKRLIDNFFKKKKNEKLFFA